ncbi:MAG: sigma-54 dependent transcriptional regulator [Verrucomicrobiota bacterium]|jgi:DNA-binding NtrC family response regulator|nr:sigma-54 dependent transcriptional regulator [Verrucomicrobiota bacterium]
MDKLLVIDDEMDVRYAFRRLFDSPDIELRLVSSGEEGMRVLKEFHPNLIIMDIRMGGMSGLQTLQAIRQFDTKTPVILMTAYGATQTAIEAMKLGAYDFVLKPFDVPKLQKLIFEALKASRDMSKIVSFEADVATLDDELGMIGHSEGMQQVFKLIGQLASSDATVLVTGESGTGKELVAKAVYQNSPRAQRSFLAINCAAIPENLLESELFGHEKGSFTGANHTRIGKFEQCHQGTLFLDEIGDMSLPTQTKMLRVLQSGTFERLGSNKPVEVDVRVIAATNQALEQAVAEKRFREDLFYRLNVVRVQLPPLRERVDDIPLLVQYFLRKFSKLFQQSGKSINENALLALQRYEWPGNVRELENVIQRAFVVTKGETILLSDLPKEIVMRKLNALDAGLEQGGDQARVSMLSEGESPEEPANTTDVNKLADAMFRWARKNTDQKLIPLVERELVKHALKETQGNQVKASSLLGITRATLRKRIEKFSIRQEINVD